MRKQGKNKRLQDNTALKSMWVMVLIGVILVALPMVTAWSNNTFSDSLIIGNLTISPKIAHDISLSSSATGITKVDGARILANQDCKLTSVTKHASATAEYVFLTSSADGTGVIATGKFSGDVATFNQQLINGTTYYLVTNLTTQTLRYNTSANSWPYNDNESIEWTGGVSDGVVTTTEGLRNWVSLNVTPTKYLSVPSGVSTLIKGYLNLSGYTSGGNVSEQSAHGITLSSSASVNKVDGARIYVNYDSNLTSVTKHASATPLNVFLTSNADGTGVLATGTFSGDIATFDYQLTAGITYYLVTNLTTHTLRYNTAANSWPYNAGNNVEWTGGVSDGVVTTTEGLRNWIALNTTRPVYLTNPSLKIGDSSAWSFTGIFNQINNRTSNLASIINKYFNTTYLVGSNYLIPFNFYSDETGILQYSSLLFDNEGFLENSQTYNSISKASRIETFIINLTYDPSYYTSISGVLTYNEISYTGTLSSETDNTKILTRSITLPSSSGTYGFYWNISLTNSSGIYYFKSNNYTQTVNPLIMILCNSTVNITFINFTTRDAENYGIRNASFKITAVYDSLNYSYQNISETVSNFQFCFDPPDLNYTVNARIEYEAVGYSKNNYYLVNSVLTNATQNIDLYLLNSSKATLTVLKAQTTTQAALPDTYIQILRYDAGTNTFYTTAMAKTDFNGEDVAYLNWYDTFYKYILTRNNEVIFMTNVSKISTTPIVFTVPTITIFYNKFKDITYSLTFNNATNNFILTYTLPSGEITSACLRVIKRTVRNDTTICNTCETSSSATIYCNINSYGNGTYIATFYAAGSLGIIESLAIFKGAISDIYEEIGNMDGSFYAFLFAGLVMVMFFISPVMGVIGMLAGMIGSVALGFQPVDYLTFIGITIIGIIIIIILKK